MSTTYGPGTATVIVRTYKEGVLSALAHDLTIEVRRFSIERDGEKVSAWFDATSLKVVGPKVLTRANTDEIEQTIRRQVLKADRFARVAFESTDGGATGSLTLCGQSRRVTINRSGTSWNARLHQPDFGIKPYSAAFGTLRIKPDVEVTVTAAFV